LMGLLSTELGSAGCEDAKPEMSPERGSGTI
jgi:hypothetical protein